MSGVCDVYCSLILLTPHRPPPLSAQCYVGEVTLLGGGTFFGALEGEGEKLTNGEVRMRYGLTKRARGHFRNRKVYSNGDVVDSINMY